MLTLSPKFNSGSKSLAHTNPQGWNKLFRPLGKIYGARTSPHNRLNCELVTPFSHPPWAVKYFYIAIEQLTVWGQSRSWCRRRWVVRDSNNWPRWGRFQRWRVSRNPARQKTKLRAESEGWCLAHRSQRFDASSLKKKSTCSHFRYHVNGSSMMA